jgi:hypothetical protein
MPALHKAMNTGIPIRQHVNKNRMEKTGFGEELIEIFLIYFYTVHENRILG